MLIVRNDLDLIEDTKHKLHKAFKIKDRDLKILLGNRVQQIKEMYSYK